MSIRLQGLQALRKHVRGFATPLGLARAPLGIAAVFLLTSLFFLAADRWFAEWMPDGEIVVLALGFLLLSRFFSQRQRYQDKYGERAFEKAFTRFNIPGLGIVAASIGHLAYIAGPQLPDVWWKPWLVVFGYIFLVSGLMLWMRAVLSLGIDSLIMLYVYLPHEGPWLESRLYGLLRHPIYAAALNIGLGLALIHTNWYALLVALLMPIFFAGWVRLVEEPDLLRRFPGYGDYRRLVPMFTPKPRNVLRLWKFMLTGE